MQEYCHRYPPKDWSHTGIIIDGKSYIDKLDNDGSTIEFLRNSFHLVPLLPQIRPEYQPGAGPETQIPQVKTSNHLLSGDIPQDVTDSSATDVNVQKDDTGDAKLLRK